MRFIFVCLRKFLAHRVRLDVAALAIVFLVGFISLTSPIFLRLGGDSPIVGAHEITSSDRQDSHQPDNAAQSDAYLEMSIPEMVATSIRDGSLTCPDTDTIVFETCQLYQGALGIWQSLKFPNDCPEQASYFTSQYDSPPKFRALETTDALSALSSQCFQTLFAIQVASTVPVLISTATKNFKLATRLEFAEPGSDPQLCIESRAGSCGNHTAVALEIFKTAGMIARSVEFYYEKEFRQSHIIPEVYIGDEWRLIDTTYGAIWFYNSPQQPMELVTTNDLLASGSRSEAFELRWNSALLPHSIYDFLAPVEPFGYLDHEPSIVRDGEGTIALNLETFTGEEKFLHRPNFIGDNKVDANSLGVSFHLLSTSETYEIIVNVSAYGIATTDTAKLCIDRACQEEIDRSQSSYSFHIEDPRIVHLETSSDIAYIVLSSIEWSQDRK